MTEETDGSEQADKQSTEQTRDPRQDRLKQALRENLKRRKVQARERSRMAGEAEEGAPPDKGAEDSSA